MAKAEDFWLEVDTGFFPYCGKRVFYELSEEEGGGSEAMEGQFKVPAFVTHRYADGRRGPGGTVLAHLHVMRPGFAGGAFDVDAEETGTPGGFRAVQSGDIAD